MTRFRLPLVFAGLLATSAAFCAPGPQSYLDGSPKSDPHLFPVRIIAVDGDAQQKNPIALTPGPHWLEIVGPSGDAKTTASSQSIVLKIQPCTYYYLGARKGATPQQNWKLVVDTEETIEACNPADEMKKAQTSVPQAPPKTH